MTLTAYSRLIRHNRNFRLLWSAQIISELGDWFYSVAIFSFLLELTGSARMVSLAFLMQVLPQVIAAPSAGVINDRMSRRRVMIIADIARAGIVLSMMFVRSANGLWLLFMLLFLETVCWALFEPARSAVLPNVTQAEDLPAANALSSTTWSINFALGAALGGAAVVVIGRDAVFVLNSVSFLVSAFLLARMRFAEPHLDNRAPLKARDLLDFSEIRDGVRYLRRNPPLFHAALVKGGIGLMGANWVILPVLGERVFPLQLPGLDTRQAATLGMSALLASRGVGALIGAFAAAIFAGSERSRLRTAIFVGFIASGVGYVLLGTIAVHFAIAIAVLFLAHAGGSTAWTSSSILLQQQTDDRFRGRVSSAEFAFMTVALSLSSYAAGRAIDASWNLRTVALLAGLMMILPAGLWFAAMRSRSSSVAAQ